MPKNRHNSRDAKIQPAEVNECERPLISYANKSPQVKGAGDSNPYPSHQNHCAPTSDPQNARPAALNLKSTTIPQQPVQSTGGPARPPQQTAPPQRQYCPKHAPSNSLATQAKPKPPPYSKATGHLTNTKGDPASNSLATQAKPKPPPYSKATGHLTNTKGDPASKVSNVDTTKSQDSRANRGASETHRHPQSSVHKKTKDGGRTKTKKSPAKDKMDNADDADGKTRKRRGPEVTSIPQTNMSIGLLVFCCFNPLLGALAIYLSLTAAKAYRDGNDRRGASRAHWSILMSLFGIMITMVVVSSLVVFFAVNKHSGRRGYRTSVSFPQGF